MITLQPFLSRLSEAYSTLSTTGDLAEIKEHFPSDQLGICAILFKKVAKMLPPIPSHKSPILEGKIHFFNPESETITNDIRLQCIKHILDKNELFYLAELLEQIKAENHTQVEELVRAFNSTYHKKTPLTFPLTDQHIRAIEADYAKKISEIDQKRILKKLDAWCNSATDDWSLSGRSGAKSRIIEFIQNPAATELYLDEFGLDTLPDIFHFPSLQKMTFLNLSNNNLSSLPPSISLSELRGLNLSQNPFESTFTKTLTVKNFPNLTKLILESNNLALPDSIGNFSKLEELHLGSLQLTTFPDFIRRLTHLKILDLSDNHLTTLPDTLLHLTNLEELNLSYNQLAVFPDPIRAFLRTESFKVSLNNNPFAGILRSDDWATALRINKSQFLYEGTISPCFWNLKTTARDLVTAWLNMASNRIKSLTDIEDQTALKIELRTFLEEAELNASFRPFFLAIIRESGNTCIDGLTLSLFHLGLARLHLDLDRGNLLPTFIALRRSLVLSTLEQIAKAKITALKHAIDEEMKNPTYVLTQAQLEYGPHIVVQQVEREILLIYPASLKEKLADLIDLPINCTKMKFSALTGVTSEDLTHAEVTIRGILTDEEKLHDTLLEDSEWRRTLELHYPAQCRHLEQQRYQELEAPTEGEDAQTKLRNLSIQSVRFPPTQLPREITAPLEAILKLNLMDKVDHILKTIEGAFQAEIIAKYNKKQTDKETYPELSIEGTKTRCIPIDRLLLAQITKKFLMPPSRSTSSKKHCSSNLQSTI
ncbi:MAG: leucine-rich repeat domain-containing protein [Simkaniaceae bacterium]|nr:leucine-rich repeat domain-containing protein [Simkaniaceae bacterium]